MYNTADRLGLLDKRMRCTRYILMPICEHKHWTIVVIDSEPGQQRAVSFDPMAGSAPWLLVGHKERIDLVLSWIRLVTWKDPEAHARFGNAQTWRQYWAHEITPPHLLPRQRYGTNQMNGCAIHILAYLMDLLSGRQEALSDLEAFKLRRPIKFILSTATWENIHSREDEDEATRASP